jgi:hypothetical protein
LSARHARSGRSTADQRPARMCLRCPYRSSCASRTRPRSSEHRQSVSARRLVKAKTAEVTGLEPAPSHHNRTGSGAPTFPTYFPIVPGAPTIQSAAPHHRPQQRGPSSGPQHTPRIAPEHWPEVAERAKAASLRDLAVAYDVSHETIRKIVWTVKERQRIPAPGTSYDNSRVLHAVPVCPTSPSHQPSSASASPPRSRAQASRNVPSSSPPSAVYRGARRQSLTAIDRASAARRSRPADGRA